MLEPHRNPLNTRGKLTANSVHTEHTATYVMQPYYNAWSTNNIDSWGQVTTVVECSGLPLQPVQQPPPHSVYSCLSAWTRESAASCCSSLPSFLACPVQAKDAVRLAAL